VFRWEWVSRYGIQGLTPLATSDRPSGACGTDSKLDFGPLKEFVSGPANSAEAEPEFGFSSGERRSFGQTLR
jgi:hypothetical protein